MRTELDLKGNDLLVYAIIYGFSQDDESKFTGSLQYLADWCGATKSGIQKNLKNLIDRGLIKKDEYLKNGVKYCEYSCILYNSVVHPPIQLSCTNNINTKNNIVKENNKRKSKKESTLDWIISKFSLYDFNDTIQDRLVDYFSDKLDRKEYPGENQLIEMLDLLASQSEKVQLEMVNSAIKGGWKTFYVPNTSNNSKQSYRLDNDTESYQSQKDRVSSIKSDTTVHTF